MLGSVNAQGLEAVAKELLHCREDGTVEVNRWGHGGVVQCVRGLASACKQGNLRMRICQPGQRGLWPVSGSKCEKIMRLGVTSLLRCVVGEVEEKGAITFTYVCEHFKMFPVEDFPCELTANHGEEKKHNSTSGWCVCCSCGMPYEWRKAKILLTRQVGNNARPDCLPCTRGGGGRV